MSEHTGAGAPYVCRYCRLNSDASGPACPNCGAPVAVSEIRDDEGWVEQPPIRDLARIQVGRSQPFAIGRAASCVAGSAHSST